MRARDDEAFAALYELYFNKLYGFIVKRVGHPEVAEDLLSAVFEKAFVGRASFGSRGNNFGAWLYTIATNTITDYWRTRKPTEEIETAETVAAASAGPSELTEQKLEHERIERALEKLSERERLCLTMKFYGNLSHEEIAKTLGLKSNHVGVIVFRALKRCQTLL